MTISWPVATPRSRDEFQLLTRKGTSVVTPYFVLQFTLTDTPATVGYTTSKKLGTAPVRNRIRRRLREAVFAQAKQKGLPHAKMVLVGRKAALKIPFENIQKALRWALHQVKAHTQ